MFNFLKKIMPTSDTTPNPLLSITDLIDYASVRPEHVVPAVKSLAAQVEAALEKAALAARVEPAALTRGDDENSNMPLYMFRAGDISVGVTKAGGIPAYLINARSIGAQRMSNQAIFRFAETYLKKPWF